MMTGEIVQIWINSFDMTISELKEEISIKGGIPSDEQRLFYATRQLEDYRSLADYNIRPESTLLAVPRLRGC